MRRFLVKGIKVNLVLFLLALIFNLSFVSLAKSAEKDCSEKAQEANTACLDKVYSQAASIEGGYPAQTEENRRNCETQFIEALGNCKTAAAYSPSNIGTIVNPLYGLTVQGLISNIIMAVMGFLGTIAFILFVYAGFLWLTSAGKSEQIKKATQTMLWAGIGLIVIFSSYFILNFVFTALSS
ncbi:MAG: hypothetical protein UT86_C0004G0083 [Candidatus Magasanikbacteria bacterium GW2011_GWC2_40_17]|uniref:Uncharacterized protein n=1 Tax=Candidatus Magasanikbacteria bacterium GW2011_GWA2_42_32 TaxID=1619039 RepID=A0A0G1CF02_9BACT|nr:MAG: hypothetical protein UT86_C0004G0083 [Candidatus Magasanikbacteria bacterium GW2011_GWC2_40_17]KKS57141.1 MAG: hypothetical protein UV20_C0003G0083 [Candidatus Magasanikbacteria bacterium GW2011_GWA2_42_32]OGH85338.1 MAG: hypothetical protein A2294_01030 [Candidatus Magasanikbacteria bacterium RIFOXYB2_FULL_38_10]